MRNDGWICCSLSFVCLEIDQCQASDEYVMTGRMACLCIVTRLEYDIPHVALEQQMRLLRMCCSLLSRCCVWGYQSKLQSSMITRYFIFETTLSPHVVIVGLLLYISLFLMNIGSSADFSLEISSLCSLHQCYT
jgi:hypothetical protein